MRLINFFIRGRAAWMFFFGLGLAMLVIAGFVVILKLTDYGILTSDEAARWLWVDLAIGGVGIAIIIRDIFLPWQPPETHHKA